MLLEDIDYAYHHNSVPPSRPQYKDFIEYVYDLSPEKAHSILAKEAEAGEFFNYFTFDGTRIPQVTHRLSLGVDFPAPLPGGISHSTVMLTALALVAAHIEGHDHFLFNIMLGGRDAEFTGVDSLMGPTLTTAPLATRIDKDATIRRNVELIQKGVDEASSVQHAPELGADLQKLLGSAPLVIVNPPDEYEEIPTKHLGLTRSRAEIRASADALCVNFCLHTGNTGVDLLMEIDPTFFSLDRTDRYFGYLEHILMHIFKEGGLDTMVREIDFGTGVPEKPVVRGSDESWGT